MLPEYHHSNHISIISTGEMIAAALNAQPCHVDDAFEHVVEKYRHEVFRLCLYHLNDENEADDATQETFLRVYRKLHQYDPARSFKTWLMTIATNYCTDCLRQRYRRSHVINIPELPSLPADDIDPEAHALTQDNCRQVREAVSQLKPKQRRLIEMRFWEECACAEIGHHLGLSESAVKSRLFRVRRLLADSLQVS